MAGRTKIMGMGFAAVVLYGLVANVLYPKVIEPLLTIDRRILDRQEDKEKLEALEARVEKGRYEYRALLGRAGSSDIGKVETDVRQLLNGLIAKNGLEEVTMTPSRASEDRKTGIKNMVITVAAEGKLASTVSFLKEVAELPHLLRVGNTTMRPVRSTGRGRPEDRMSFRVPIELRVPPPHPMVGRIEDDKLDQPETVVRHQNRDYGLIWSGTPFMPFVPLKPLRVDAGPNQSVNTGRIVTLKGTATGGDGAYKYIWSPGEGLSGPGNARTKVDTSKAGEQTYTLSVTDGSGMSATGTVTVTVKDRVASVSTKPKPEPKSIPPPPPKEQRWPDGRYMQIVMTLLQTVADEQLSELMVFDRKRKETAYYGLGDEFDGGELVFVHQTGGVVRRNNEYFVYPLGAQVSEHLMLHLAEGYPELYAAANELKAEQEAQAIDESSGINAKRTPADRPPAAKTNAATHGAVGGAGGATGSPTIELATPDRGGDRPSSTGGTSQAAQRAQRGRASQVKRKPGPGGKRANSIPGRPRGPTKAGKKPGAD